MNLSPHVVACSVKLRPLAVPEKLHLQKKSNFLYFPEKYRKLRQKIDGHQPLTTCYSLVKFEFSSFVDPEKSC